MKLINSTFLIFLSLVFSSMQGFAAQKKERIKLQKETLKQVMATLEINETLHQSFFKYDAKQVEAQAKKLEQAISSIKDEKLTKLLKFSKGKLAEIKASNARDVNNQNYHLVSMALIYVVNTYEVGKYNAYSCPMVKKKWVQNSAKMDKVHNPYAPEMPHCGSKDSNY